MDLECLSPLSLFSHIPCQLAHLESSTLSHNAPLFSNKLYLHFVSKATLNKEMPFVPKPSSSFGLQIFFHPTQDIFSFPSSHTHKNLLCNLTNFLEIPSRIFFLKR